MMFRRVVIFLLGVVVIIDSLAEKQTASVGKLVVGLIMVGALPLDDLVRLVARRPLSRTDDTEARTGD
jgi:hypothetical protein